jgi:outer membrane biosynthesis protein TonB
MHPLVVHFPIALLVCAVGVMAWQKLRGGPEGREALFVYLGAASAALASSMGLLWAAMEPARGSELEQLNIHRTLTVVGTVAAVVAAVLYARWPSGRNDMIKAIVLCAAAGLVSSGAHLGGTLVFGDDHFSAPFDTDEPAAEELAAEEPAAEEPAAEEPAADEPEAAPEAAEEPPAPAAPPAPAPVAEPAAQPEVAPVQKAPVPRKVEPVEKKAEKKPARTVDFQKDIYPILKKSCLKCHGPKKKKGKLRLDKKKYAMKGGESGKVIKPGNAKKSKLYQLIILPEDDEDVMPSKGDLLTKEQQALFETWINEGAHWPE